MHPSVSSLVENRRPTGASPPAPVTTPLSSAIATWGLAPAKAASAGSGHSRGTGPATSNVVPGEIKPQKACQSCRRSKVRCVHDGQPPCKRCSDQNIECKFRLRAVSCLVVPMGMVVASEEKKLTRLTPDLLSPRTMNSGGKGLTSSSPNCPTTSSTSTSKSDPHQCRPSRPLFTTVALAVAGAVNRPRPTLYPAHRAFPCPLRPPLPT